MSQLAVRAYTPEEVADLYQVSKNTIYKMIGNQEISYKKIGRFYRIPYTEVMWIVTGLDQGIQDMVTRD